MTALLQFSSLFWGWMDTLRGTQGYDSLSRPSKPSEQIQFTPDGYEIYYHLSSLPDGWVRLARSDRGNTPDFLFDFASMDGAEAYLCVIFADDVRNVLGFVHQIPRDYLRTPDRVGMESGRLQERVVPWQGPVAYDKPLRMRVYSAGNEDRFRGPHPTFDYVPKVGAYSRGVSLTWYLDKPLAEVLESLRNPTGAPLFELIGDRFE